jgi:H-NS histone C-terminal domain
VVNFYMNARKVAARGTGFPVTPRLFIIVPDQRLRELGLDDEPHKISHARRPYPQVFPKYRNPAEPSETWAGRGKKPRWLTAQLKSGKRIDGFRIDLAAA